MHKFKKYCEYVYLDEYQGEPNHVGECCRITKEICPHYFSSIKKNCCELRLKTLKENK